VCLPQSDLLASTPHGAAYTTSFANDHDHSVLLTQDDLTTIAGGGTVTVTTTSAQGHTHDFSIQRNDTQSAPIAPLPSPTAAT
jgi:hypothetical protein